MKALIDGDIIAYSCGFAAQATYYDVEGHTCLTKREAKEYCEEHAIDYSRITPFVEAEPVENALHNAKALIERCTTKTMSDDYTVFLTGDSNFRDELVTYYKANRDRDAKPVHYEELIDYLLGRHKAVMVDGQEADDAMAQEQWRDFVDNEGDITELETVICTIDKDLDMIPGWHYNWRKDEVYTQRMSDALIFFYTQLLTGDRVDNIPGVPGIGPVKAAKILDGCTTEHQLYMAVYGRYYDAVLTTKLPAIEGCSVDGSAYHYLIENAHLLWIRREEGQEWVPPTERGYEDE